MIIACALSSALAMGAVASSQSTPRPPNFVVVFCDDLGYGDLGSFGHPTIRTPELDRMALEGMKWTSFYCAAPVCTPSRAGLLTGQIDQRYALFELGDHLVGEDAYGLHHDVARD